MEKATEILKNNNLAVTSARKHILTFLIHKSHPVTAEDVWTHVKKEFDQATVYRTLNAFVENQIIDQLYFKDSKAYFEYQKNHHHHITCTSCELKEETKICPQIKDVLSESKNFTDIQSHTLELFGVCNSCRN